MPGGAQRRRHARDTSGFAKYEITGAGAEGWLSHMLANKVPAKSRMTLAPMLKEDGKLIGDFSLAKADDERFYIFGSGAAENYHMRWFEQHLPEDGSVKVHAFGLEMCGLSIAGPNSQKLLAKLTNADVSTARSPSCRSAQWTSAWYPQWSPASASPVTWVTRCGSRRNISPRCTP